MLGNDVNWVPDAVKVLLPTVTLRVTVAPALTTCVP